jgi:outer membrane protein
MNRSVIMKNYLIITVIAVAAMVAAAGCGPKQAEPAETGTTVQDRGIAYVELDTVIAYFDMANDKGAELDEKTKSSEAELTAKSQAFDRDVRDYQNKAQKGLITRATAAEMEQTLSQQQQNLLALRDQMAMNLNEESVVAQRQVLEYINQFLVEYNEEHGYQYILAKQFPGPILYSDTTMDITDDVITGLNAKYNAEKDKAKK